MTVLITVVALSLAMSALCSLLEATLYSTRIAALEAARGDARHRRRASLMLRMKRNIAVPTAAILILNTLANTAGATIAGMHATTVIGNRWVPLFSVCLTLGILLLSEILPKTYGATHWRVVWPSIVWPLTTITRLLAPAVWLTQRFAALFTTQTATSSVTEDEIVAMIRLGAKSGELTPAELTLLDAIFNFDAILCRQVMVPRRQVVWLERDAPFSAWIETIRREGHTRYPVCATSLDDAVGLLHIKDIVGLTGAPDDALRPIVRVPGTMRVNKLLPMMQQSRSHMALVVDEHGAAAGVVTLENVLEQIVGPVQDEFDAEPPDIVAEERGRYRIGGHVLTQRLDRELSLDLYAPEVDTLSGLIVHKLGRMPIVGDRLELSGASAEVLVVHEERAALVRVTVESAMTADDEQEPESGAPS